MVEHFSIVLGLCRSAMQVENPAVRTHVERLVKALEKSQELDHAASLRKLLVATDKMTEIVPSRVVLSRSMVTGEILTPSVLPPVDKETGAPLAEIVNVKDSSIKQPIFNDTLANGVNTLLQEWAHVDDLRNANIRPALTTMLFGDPGTGKTMLAHYIASQLGLPLVVARLDGLISSFLGTTARNISSLFAFANRYRCVLLLDEFDAVAKLRDDPHELGEIKRVVNTLIQCMDGRAESGFTIAITNHESLLDPAIWRRFDIRIEVPKPEAQTRIEIFRKNLGDSIFDETQLRFLAWASEGASGSDIAKLADFLKRQRAIRKQDFDFLSAIRNYVQMSAQEIESKNREVIGFDNEKLTQALAHDRVLPFAQEQLAVLFGCSQPTISRWIKKEKSTVGD